MLDINKDSNSITKKNIKKAQAEIRRDTPGNWKKAKNFIPQIGMIIVYDFEDGRVGLKLGDGKLNVNDLPFLNNIEETANKNNPFIKGETLVWK